MFMTQRPTFLLSGYECVTLMNLFDSLTKAELFGICEELNYHGNEHIGIA